MFGRKKKTSEYGLPELSVYGESILKARSREYDPNYIYVSSKLKRSGDHQVIKLRSAASSADTYLPFRYDDNLKDSFLIIPAWLQKNLNIKSGAKMSPQVCTAGEAEAALAMLLKVIKVGGRDYFDELDAGRLSSELRRILITKPLSVGQFVMLKLDSKRIELQVTRLITKDGVLEQGAPSLAVFEKNSILEVTNTSREILDFEMLEIDPMVQDTFEIPLDFSELGVGGHKQIIQDLIRRVFYTRVMSQDALAAYGVEKHDKGVLLYGPPGTGKTLIASAIVELLPSSQFVKVNGPEVMSSYVGASQANIGNIFKLAKENPHKLYIFFFDELEAISRERQGQGGTSAQVGNEMVSRLLTELDGANSADNVVFIGATNRKDLIDPALLRAGRLDAQFYVGLPSFEDRLEILEIHANKIQLRADDWNLKLIAEKTKNYSGAELARVVDVARTYALRANIDTSLETLKMKDVRSNKDLAKVSQAHFLQALNEVKPDFGAKEVFATRPDKFQPNSPAQKAIADDFKKCLSSFLKEKQPGQFNYMISGDPRSGKTSIAEYMAFHSGIQHIQVVSVTKMMAMTEIEQRRYIAGVFANTRDSIEPSIIILDGIEDILMADPEHKQYNNMLRVQLNALLKPDASRSNKLIVIGCCQDRAFIQRLGLGDYLYSAPKLHLSNIKSDLPQVNKLVINGPDEPSHSAPSLFRPSK